jgi:hypothetical protein
MIAGRERLEEEALKAGATGFILKAGPQMFEKYENLIIEHLKD